MPTSGIRNFFDHVTFIVSGITTEIPKPLRAQVKEAFCEALRSVDEVDPPIIFTEEAQQLRLARFEENLALIRTPWIDEGGMVKLWIPEGQKEEILRLILCFTHPEWKNAAPPLEGIYDHFKGGAYLLRRIAVFADGKPYVEYLSLKNGRYYGRYQEEWNLAR